MSRQTGGAAFPRPHSWDEAPHSGMIEGDRPAPHAEQTGMTLRDYFAAKAMAAFVTINASEAAHQGSVKWMPTFAADAYMLADAMLQERAK